MNHSASTQLWIGSPHYLNEQVVLLVQKHYCPQQGCGYCTVCQQIKIQQHHAFLTLTTVKSTYSRSDLEGVFSKIAFAGNQNEPFFCVISQAEKLSPACANSLLKLLEEPPIGWHWLLLTERPQELLPTVISRCVVQEFKSLNVDTSSQELYLFLTNRVLGDIVQFQQLLDRAKLSEYDSRLLFDRVCDFWVSQMRTSVYAGQISHLFHAYRDYQAMPGSSKFFWRTLYLKMGSLVR